MKKRNVIVSTLMAAALLATAVQPVMAADKPEYEMRITYCYTDHQPHGVNAQNFKKNVEEATGGRVAVTLYPASQLADASTELSVTLSGACEAVYTVSQVASTVNPYEAIWNAPFMMQMEPGETYWSKLLNENEVVQDILNTAAEEAGFKRLGDLPTSSGLILGNNKVPLNGPEDLNGLKIRTPAGDMINLFLSELGASVIPVSGTEIIVALEQGVVDGVTSTYCGYYDAGWVCKYLTKGTYCWSCTPMYVNLNWWNSLPEDIQEDINEAFDKTWDEAAEYMAEREHIAIDGLENELGSEFAEWDYSDPDVAAFADSVKEKAIEQLKGMNGDRWDELIAEIERIEKEDAPAAKADQDAKYNIVNE